MTDLVLQIGASKLAISVVLAGLASALTRRFGRPELSHALWLLLLAARLGEASVGTGVPPSQGDLEAVIRRSASIREAGWRFSAVFGFAGSR